MASRAPQLAGERFGRLEVIVQTSGQWEKDCCRARWVCRCDCGAEVVVLASNLRRGSTKSCGCLRRTRARSLTASHGHAPQGGISRTYKSWQSMRQRTTNRNAPDWHRYGGRGITCCARWLHSYEAFLEDMGERPAGMSIDRIDNDGNYEPGNCRWATPREQRANQSAVAA